MTGLFLEAERLILPDSVQKAQWKQMVERFTSLDAETFLRDFTGQLIWVVLKIGVAIAIYAVGRWVIRRIVHLMDASFDRRQVDRSLQSFLRSLLKGAAYTLLLLIIVQLLGFNTTSLVALLAASGFGIGMALSGTLQNFAGGVMVMFMHPYRIGDYIEAQGQARHGQGDPPLLDGGHHDRQQTHLHPQLLDLECHRQQLFVGDDAPRRLENLARLRR